MIKRELLLNKNIFLIFSLIIFCMIVGVSFIYPSIIDSNANIDEMIKVFPKEFLEAFNMDIISLSKFFGWLATEGYLFLQLLSGSLFAIIGSTILLKEKSDHTIDFLAVKPITKNKIITNKLLSGIIYILIFTILTFISVLIGLKINNEIVLVTETKIPKQKLEQELKERNFEFDKLIITKIPRDPRHNSKIDYHKLKKILS